MRVQARELQEKRRMRNKMEMVYKVAKQLRKSQRKADAIMRGDQS